MTKNNVIFVSILLIIASAVIELLMTDNHGKLVLGMSTFVAGILFGAGILFLYKALFTTKYNP